MTYLASSSIVTQNPYSVAYQQEVEPSVNVAAPASSGTPLLSRQHEAPGERAKLEGQIVRFLNDHLGKSRWKAERIVARLPACTTVNQLKNIYGVLEIMRMDALKLSDLREKLSWEQTLAEYMFCMDSAGFGDTTKEQRLKLRALSLYVLSAIDPKLYNDDFRSYESLQKSYMFIVDFLRNCSIQAIKSSLERSKEFTCSPGDDNDIKAKLLSVVVNEFEDFYKV